MAQACSRGWTGRTGLVGFSFPLPPVHPRDIRNEVFTAGGAAIWALLTTCRPVWPWCGLVLAGGEQVLGVAVEHSGELGTEGAFSSPGAASL